MNQIDFSGKTKETGRPPLVIIAGPTATGKSDLAVELCRRMGGSVVSADSMQVYHDMPIGSARILPEEMKGIDHYLVDLIDPKDEWNVVRFQQEAKSAIRKIQEEGKLPFLTGGTGFYIQALLYDIDFTQMDSDPDYRGELEGLLKSKGASVLYEQLRAVDPAAAEAIGPYNGKRLIRALEFYRESGGQRISEHNQREKERQPAYNAVYFCLTMDRKKLYRRIDQRVDRMIEAGLVDEVQALKNRGLTEHDVSMQGLGYRQLFPYLSGECTLEEAAAQIKQQTRHFAKRQLTWFRREEKRMPIHWVHVDTYQDMIAIADDMERIIDLQL